jgi:N-terminal domain on NACHT_NTPase and P-loop NTPases
MAALDALSLAATIVQLVDFASKLVSKGYHVYRSADGALPHNLEMEAVAKDLSHLTARLRSRKSLGNPSVLTEDERALEALAEKCSEIASTLLGRLDKLKVKKEERHRGWKSARQALKSVWNKKELDDLAQRLSNYRDQLQFSILFSMK